MRSHPYCGPPPLLLPPPPALDVETAAGSFTDPVR
jgi:hypothetical protein